MKRGELEALIFALIMFSIGAIYGSLLTAWWPW